MHDPHVLAPSTGALLGKTTGGFSTPLPPVGLRAGPGSSRGRESFRPWSGNIPTGVMGGYDPVVVSVRQQRRIGGAAMALWRHLVDMRGCGDRVMSVSLIRVSADTGAPGRTIDRALARLVVMGAVQRWRTREKRGTTWVSRLDLRVFGGIDVVRGRETVWMPCTILTWCDLAKPQGRPRQVAESALSLNRKGGGSGVDPAPNLAIQSPGINHLDPKGGAPKILQAYQGDESFFPTGKKGDAMHRTPTVTKMGMIKAPAIDQKNLPKTAIKASTLTGDSEDRATRHQWIRSMSTAYNTVCQEVFGVPGRCYPPAAKAAEFASWDPAAGTIVARPEGPDDGGALEKWRSGKVYLYDKLLSAALILHEKGIAPAAWARWVMVGSRDSQISEGKKPTPRPVLAVFAETAIGDPRRRAMFYGQNGGQYGHEVQPTNQHLEQLYRLQESRRRSKGWTYLWGLPPWYVEIRKVEIAQGVDDPLDRFPVILGAR